MILGKNGAFCEIMGTLTRERVKCLHAGSWGIFLQYAWRAYANMEVTSLMGLNSIVISLEDSSV